MMESRSAFVTGTAGTFRVNRTVSFAPATSRWTSYRDELGAHHISPAGPSIPMGDGAKGIDTYMVDFSDRLIQVPASESSRVPHSGRVYSVSIVARSPRYPSTAYSRPRPATIMQS